MDETTYSDDAVIAAVREHFVPVRVDNDERPDINARYNMGGWPTTAFLAADGTTLTGATYLPPDRMAHVLREVATWYAKHRTEIPALAQARPTESAVQEPAEADDLAGERIVTAIASTFDEEYGGFGDAPKFPQPELLETLLAYAQANDDDRLRRMVVRTLLAMARGGMYDRVEGGFFRYSTTRDWSIPHFEKMAEDHAGLIRALALLLERAPHAELRETLTSAVGYVMTVLRDARTGFFGGSQDADEVYYGLPLDDRRAREAPYVDRTLYTDRNAALAGALALASATLDDDACAAAALFVLDGMEESMRDVDGLLYHVRRTGREPSIRGLLADHCAYLRALLDAHEVSGEARFLERAEAIASLVIARFGAEHGGFYDRADVEAPLGRLALPDRPIVENALLAESFLRLEELRAPSGDRAVAERALAVYASSSLRMGSFAAAYARAVLRLRSSGVCVRIVGTPAQGVELRRVARRLPSPFVAIRTIAVQRAYELELPAEPAPRAYVCSGRACGAPVESAADLRASYDALAHERLPVPTSPKTGEHAPGDERHPPAR